MGEDDVADACPKTDRLDEGRDRGDDLGRDERQGD
jgi:hypothetical protein